MKIVQLPNELNAAAMKIAMKPDERIVCRNATVIMDGKGNISYFNNETAICLIGEEK